MITELYISGVVGLTYLENPELANVEILTVSRQGMIYKDVTTTPTGREFKYTTTGRLDFGTAFEEVVEDIGAAELLVPEKVYVKYKA